MMQQCFLDRLWDPKSTTLPNLLLMASTSCRNQPRLREETEKAVGFALVRTGQQLLGFEEGSEENPVSPARASPCRHGTATGAGIDITEEDVDEILREGDCSSPPAERPPPKMPSPKATRVVGTHNSKPEDHRQYQLQVRHSCLQDIWDEWFGLGRFADSFGGIAGCNQLHKNKWRLHLKGDLYSCNKRLIEGVQHQMKVQKCQPESILAEWDVLFKNMNCSVGNLVKSLQHQKLLKVGKPRGASKQAIQKQRQQQQTEAGGPSQ
ncbi:hypothetical protein SEMRO_1563_G282670.1 [Seminavis robusta]|uniref:Uncharacterized protein n=1 Tax=Seminavis robusta TaxID=568900 RepID=A0A9N8EQM4_9STRA|nr:hypothetical protein SEMRO_1563_G282670.1 [Seminavis robusta]|eukprot:Sro1563_g282670.1 n/a (265) ;mRNA; f:4238-5032